MSWKEYSNMWSNAQKNGRYHLFIFDVVNSRECGDFKPAIRKLLYEVYNKLADLETERDKKILHTCELFNKGNRGDLSEPFLFMSDLFGFTVIRGSITNKEIYRIFRKSKKELGISYTFHKGNGYYETDDIAEGMEKYFRGYCMQYLENRMKNNKIKI